MESVSETLRDQVREHQQPTACEGPTTLSPERLLKNMISLPPSWIEKHAVLAQAQNIIFFFKTRADSFTALAILDVLYEYFINVKVSLYNDEHVSKHIELLMGSIHSCLSLRF